MFNSTQENIIKAEAWKVGTTLFFGILTILFFSTIIDVVAFNNDWFDLFILKSILSLLFYVTFKFSKKYHETPNLLLHIVLFSFNCMCLIAVLQIGTPVKIIYLSLLSIVFISFNAITLWSTKNSLLQYFLVLLAITTLIYTKTGSYSKELFFQGVYLFMVTGIISVFFPKFRRNNLKEIIQAKLEQKQKINSQNLQILEAESELARVKDLVANKNNTNKYLSQQINQDLREIKKTYLTVTSNSKWGSLEDKTTPLLSLKKMLDHHEDQCHLFFNPINILTNDEGFQLKKENIDISNILDELLILYELQIKSKNIVIEKTFKTERISIEADEEALQIIIDNILEFIIQYSYNNNTIEIGIKNSENKVFLNFKNEKNGLSSNEIETYFNDMDYIKYTKNRRNNNTKTGLSIAKKLTEDMGGHLTYMSSKTRGYQFNLQFKSYQ